MAIGDRGASGHLVLYLVVAECGQESESVILLHHQLTDDSVRARTCRLTTAIRKIVQVSDKYNNAALNCYSVY